MGGVPPAGTGQANDPLRFGREIKLSPMPKDFQVQGSRVRTLAIAKQATVLSDLDTATFEVRRQVRGLPLIHKILVAPDGFSLGYRQRHGDNPAELHFIDPDLHLARSFSPTRACAGFAQQKKRWIVARGDGALDCFCESGSHAWTWRVPPDRHGESPLFHVAATGDLIFAAGGLYLYALTPDGRLLREWKLPNQPAQTHRAAWTVGGEGRSHGALRTLGLQEPATAEEVRRAYRRMARLTHPDFHPHDALAAMRFRAVREAYEALQDPRGRGGSGALHIRFSLMPTTAIRSLSVNKTFVAVGTTEGDVYLCGHDGKILYHAGLGGQVVHSILLSACGVQAAYCYPRLFRFEEGLVSSSDPIMEYSVQLIARGEDTLLWGWNRMWLFDPQARVRATGVWDRKINGVASSTDETILLSGGHLYAIPHR